MRILLLAFVLILAGCGAEKRPPAGPTTFVVDGKKIHIVGTVQSTSKLPASHIRTAVKIGVASKGY